MLCHLSAILMYGSVAAASAQIAREQANGPIPMDLRIVPQDTTAMYDAASLDGSPPAYYFTKASDTSLATTWVLYFKGGGWSYDEVESLDRSRSSLGSSKNLASTFYYDGGPASPVPEYNSLAGANRVVLWYTDGASFTGNRAGNVPVPGTNETIRCRGFANLQAILHDLEAEHGLSQGTKILVSGGSAGGLAAYLHTEYLGERYSKQATVVSAPASGFFLDHPNAAGDYIYPEQMKYVFGFQNSTAGLNPKCLEAQASGDEWKCIMAQYSYAHTTFPLFIMNSPWDSWQEKCEFTSAWAPIESDKRRAECAHLTGYEDCGTDFGKCNSTQMGQFNGYAAEMLQVIKETPKYSQPGNGAFLHSCVTHVASQSGTDWMNITIDGTSFRGAFDAWWRDASIGKLAPAEEHTHLPCQLHTTHPYACNPTCHQ